MPEAFVMSANNACGTLKKLVDTAVGANGAPADSAPLESFIRDRVRAVMTMIAREDHTEDADFAAVRQSEENKRQALESVVANIPAITGNPSVMAALRVALAGAWFWRPRSFYTALTKD